MSLTSHLDDKQSPIRQFIYAAAPQLARAGTAGREGKALASSFGFDQITALETQIPIPNSVTERKSHAIVAGIALDYRIRMDLPGFEVEGTEARRGLDLLAKNLTAVHRGKHIHQVLSMALSFAHLTLQQKDRNPASLALLSVALAWCESITRIGPAAALSGSAGRQIKRAKDATDLMLSIDESLVIDIAGMRDAVSPVLDDWNSDISAGVRYQPNPRFLGSPAVGGADGDWLVGDLLVELKTTESVTNPWLRETLFQLLGYALLDLDDSLGIRRVGILLPRQPFAATWSLDDLLGQDSATALPQIRQKFTGLLMASIDRRVAKHRDPDASAL